MPPDVTSRKVEPSRLGAFAPVLVLSITLDPEYGAVKQFLPRHAEPIPQTPIDKLLEINRWVLRRNDNKEMEIATGYINGMGNARTAIETATYLQRISPRYVFLCGIAGSLEPGSVPLGDVVIGTMVEWWNLNKVQPSADVDIAKDPSKYLTIGPTCFRKEELSTLGDHTQGWKKRLTEFQNTERRQLPSNNDGKLLGLKATISGQERPRLNEIHYGKIVSWEYVLSHGEVRDELRQRTNGLAIEMEGAGFHASIARRNEELDVRQKQTQQQMGSEVKGFIFRGISDLSHRKGTEPDAWRKIAMYNAAFALVEFLRTFTDMDFRD